MNLPISRPSTRIVNRSALRLQPWICVFLHGRLGVVDEVSSAVISGARAGHSRFLNRCECKRPVIQEENRGSVSNSSRWLTVLISC